MLGLMQHHPFLISSLLEHAARAYQSAQIVSLTPGATPTTAAMPTSPRPVSRQPRLGTLGPRSSRVQARIARRRKRPVPGVALP